MNLTSFRSFIFFLGFPKYFNAFLLICEIVSICLSIMGNFSSVSISRDQILNRATQWFIDKESYIHNLEDNLSILERATEELKAWRDDLLGRAQREGEDREVYGSFPKSRYGLKESIPSKSKSMIC